MNVLMPMLLFFFFAALIPLEAKVSKCYLGSSTDGFVEAQCAASFEEFCGRVTCNGTGKNGEVVPIHRMSCGNSSCNLFSYPLSVCECFNCNEDLCNNVPASSSASMTAAVFPIIVMNAAVAVAIFFALGPFSWLNLAAF